MSDQPNGPRRPGDEGLPLPTTSGPAVFFGIALLTPVLMILVIATWGPVGIVLAVAWVVGALLMLRSSEPFVRGLGVGLLIGGGIALLLVGSCLAILSGIDA
jgi:hypothetical protein